MEAVVGGVGGTTTAEKRPSESSMSTLIYPYPRGSTWGSLPPRAASPRPARQRGRVVGGEATSGGSRGRRR
jgi:hypothetical protein